MITTTGGRFTTFGADDFFDFFAIFFVARFARLGVPGICPRIWANSELNSE